MSMLNYLFDNDWMQRRDLESLRSQVSNYEDRMRWSKLNELQLSEKMYQLEAKLGRLNLLAAALARIVIERELIKPPELSELMRQIDLEDGEQDGQLREKVPKVPEWCPKCEARIAPGKVYCVFCGKRFDEQPNHEQENHACVQSEEIEAARDRAG